MVATSTRRKNRLVKNLVVFVGIVALLGLMVLHTSFPSEWDFRAVSGEKFSPEEFANQNFDQVIVPYIKENAHPPAELLARFQADYEATGEEFGGRDGVDSAWAFPVEFTGIAGEVKAVNGQLPVTVEGIPDSLSLVVQTGPPVIGVALRNVTGDIKFGMFVNQMEFQDVAAKLNGKVREGILAGIDAAAMNGKTVHVVGVFAGDQWKSQWIVTPVEIEVVG